MSTKKKQQGTEQTLSYSFRSGAIGVNPGGPTKALPSSYKVGRTLLLSGIHRQLELSFDEPEESKLDNESIIVSQLTSKITEYDLKCFTLGMAQILYNQSYQHGNEEQNFGIEEIRAKDYTRRKNARFGVVDITLNDICRVSYGVDEPTTEQKRTMANLIDSLHHYPVIIKYSNGDENKEFLCTKQSESTRAKDGAKAYRLNLHPIFTDTLKGYGLISQDLRKKITIANKEANRRTTSIHLDLVKLLASHDKRQPLVIYMATLVQKLGLEDAYRKNVDRTEQNILNALDCMVAVGLVDKSPVLEKISIRGKERINRITLQVL